LKRKGIILAGGNGTRLHPITKAVSKHLLPVYDKPMIYYPLSTLLLAGIKEILIITNPRDTSSFKALLGDGSDWGITIAYAEQLEPAGVAEAYLLAKNFLGGCASALILGDNFFYGNNFSDMLQSIANSDDECFIFGYSVSEPERYGVLELSQNNEILRIEEKPLNPTSNIAVTGLYFLDNRAPEMAKSLVPSSRGELEIADLLNLYAKTGRLKHRMLGRGFAWIDMGTPESLLEASGFIRTIQKRQGLQIASIDEIINIM